MNGEGTVANYKDLKPGDEVWIKEPSHIYARVIGPREGDAELPPEERMWRVEILPRTQYLPPDHFELVHPPKDPNAPHKYMSKEWVEELDAFHDSATRYAADNSDKTSMTASLESLRKLGFIKPK
jgi:hypothetical protein